MNGDVNTTTVKLNEEDDRQSNRKMMAKAKTKTNDDISSLSVFLCSPRILYIGTA